MTSIEKALGTTSGTGGDLVIPRLASMIIPYIFQKSYWRQFYQSFEMPTQTFRFPKMLSAAQVYYIGENTTAPVTPLTTGTVELTAKKLMVSLPIAAELEEDAVLPIVPVLRSEMAKSFAYAEENIFINGDTTHTATQTDPTSGTDLNWYVYDQRLAFDGAIKFAGVESATVGTFSLPKISSAIQSLDKYGRDKSELLLTVSLREEASLRNILGINLAVNQLGLTGTALPGEIGKVYGIPVVATNLLAGTGSSTALLANRNAAIIGDRRTFTIKTSNEVLIQSDALLLVASERISFKAAYSDAMVKMTGITA